MKNSQLDGPQQGHAGTAWMRRWWTGEKPSVRLFEVASGLVLAGALVWAGWFASASQAATWSTGVVTIAIVAAVSLGSRRSRMSRSR
jgi:hypothetical protein